LQNSWSGRARYTGWSTSDDRMESSLIQHRPGQNHFTRHQWCKNSLAELCIMFQLNSDRA
jgi:hypothetical protein